MYYYDGNSKNVIFFFICPTGSKSILEKNNILNMSSNLNNYLCLQYFVET